MQEALSFPRDCSRTRCHVCHWYTRDPALVTTARVRPRRWLGKRVFAVPPGYSGLRGHVRGCSDYARKGWILRIALFVTKPSFRRTLTMPVFLLGFEETCLSCRVSIRDRCKCLVGYRSYRSVKVNVNVYDHVYRCYGNCDKYFRVNGRDDICYCLCPCRCFLFIYNGICYRRIFFCFRILAKQGNFTKQILF